MKRLFVGLELTEEARHQVVAIQDRLRAVATRQGVRFVRPEKIHLTLVFLGHLSEDSIPVLDTACIPVGERHLPFELTAQELGGFPDLRRPRVLWLGVGGETERLQALQADLALGLAPHVDLDEKPFSPHLTLARISPGSKEVGRLAGGVAAEVGGGEIARWRASEVVLFESTADGRYEAVSRWPLAIP
jgi:2'-5' RNA ligase